MKNIRNEKGVALLFSLGVMSLMLVTGLAFLANALTSQKIAVSNSSRGQSKMLALSAAHRAMYATMAFMNQHKDECRIGQIENVFSRVSSGGTNDQLGAKLTVKQDGSTFYDGTASGAKWIYIHENGSDSNGSGTVSSKIIGRYAFQLLPPLGNSKSRLSLFATTRGASMEAGEGIAAYNSSTAKTRVPQISRWGIDGDELNFSNSVLFPLWTTSTDPAAPIKEFDTFFSVLSYTGGPLKESASVPQATINSRRRGIRYWFAEGMGRLSPEAYFDGTMWRHRFNLGHIDGLAGSPVPKTAAQESSAANTNKDRRWYQRLIAGNKTQTWNATDKVIMNSAQAVEKLAGDAIGYTATDVSSTDGSASLTQESGSDKISGLPFLKRIAHEKGSFDTIELRRKQIAANLNDYCDADDIPTSDVPADTWTTASVYKNRTTVPSYTGNEKTPYLNELGMQFLLDIGAMQNGSGKFSSQKVKTTIKVTPKMLVELIDIYGGLQNYSPAVKMNISNLKVTLNLKAKCSFDYKYTDGDTTKSGTFSGEVSSEGVTKDFSADFNNGTTIAQGKMSYSNGYFYASSVFGSLTADTDSPVINLSDSLATATGHADALTTVSNFNYTELKLAVSKVEFALSDVVVFKKGTESQAVDYVKMPTETISVTSSNLDDYATDLCVTKDSRTSLVGAIKDFQYLGGMEVRDPRQNLNVYQNDAKSDWFFKPVIGNKDTALSMDFSTVTEQKSYLWGLIKINTKTEEALSAGRKNSCSSPATPKDGIGNAMTAATYDPETVTDPAATSGTADAPAISTAVIRNAPMRSPWELGFISRGAPWQTINLKKAGGFYAPSATESSAESTVNHIPPSGWDDKGTMYSRGDGGILDEIKMTDQVKSFGKVNLNALGDTTAPADVASVTQDVAQAVFAGIRRQSAVEFIKESFGAQYTQDIVSGSGFPQNTSGLIGTVVSANYGAELVNNAALKSNLNSLVYRSQILQKTDLFTRGQTIDAAQEELVGKTLNLLDTNQTGQPELPNVFRVIVVAQTIRDLSGTVGRTGTGTSTTNSSDQVYTQTCATGTFDFNTAGTTDYRHYRYYDEILSEVRMLVTIERINYFEVLSGKVYRVPKARLRIRQIEYLD